MIIDAHCHASPLVFEPVEPLIFQMDRNGVEKAVLTQVLGQFDNSYQQECVARYPGRLANVGAVDTNAKDAAEKVTYWAGRGMVGLRIRPEARSQGTDPLAVWQAAADAGIAINCGGAASNILSDDFAALVGEFSEMPFVLEQIGGWTRPDCDKEHATWKGIMQLSRFINVSLKIPSLGQIAPREIGKPLPSAPPILDASKGEILIEVLETFGPDRMMWGSDFPVVGSREGYANAIDWTREVFTSRPEVEIDAIFWRTADRIFFGGPA